MPQYNQLDHSQRNQKNPQRNLITSVSAPVCCQMEDGGGVPSELKRSRGITTFDPIDAPPGQVIGGVPAAGTPQYRIQPPGGTSPVQVPAVAPTSLPVSNKGGDLTGIPACIGADSSLSVISTLCCENTLTFLQASDILIIHRSRMHTC